MKTRKNMLLLACIGMVAVQTACTNYDADDYKFGNVVYLDVAETSEVQAATIKNTLDVFDRTFAATLAYPSDQDVTLSVTVDPSLVERYNARYGTATGALPLDETYLVPVTIAQSSVPTLATSSTVYYVVKRSSNITVAAQLGEGNWINFPTLDKYGANSQAWNGLTAVTYEALIYIDQFATSTVTSDGNTNAVNISSVMGVEQYLLLRIGDTNFERQQLQFDGSGTGSKFGKFPDRDATKNLSAGQWYHVACTYDQATRRVCVYVNGELQSEGTEMGLTSMSEDTRINLAMRALYDYYLSNPTPDNEKKYGGFGDAYQFFIGKSYDNYRPLNGKIAEARVWSVARTQQQIWENMYEIADPASDPTLLGYWKFNEGAGNTVKDYSMYGNDGEAEIDIVWPDGIEIPKINETEE